MTVLVYQRGDPSRKQRPVESILAMIATYELDSEAYTWTDVPAPGDPFWVNWREGDRVVRVCRVSRS